VSARLDEHLVSAWMSVSIRVHVAWQERLAAGHLDELASVPMDFRHDGVDRHLAASVNAYGVSHQAHRKSQAVSRTNTHGRPTWVDSPWIDR